LALHHLIVQDTTMLKIITLIACVIGFVFLGPKALAEFRQTGRSSRRLREKPERTAIEEKLDKPQSDVAA